MVVEDTILEDIVTLLGEEEDVRHVLDVACLFAERAWLGLESSDVAQLWINRALAMQCPHLYRGELLDWQHRVDPIHPLGPLNGVRKSYFASLSGDWRTSASEWARIGDPYRQALALAEGDAVAVMEALTILEKLGALAVVEHVRSAARDRGLKLEIPSQPRAATRANPVGLTRRQMDVLRLLNNGLSNAEIGARLFVSPKTVDHHVSAILAKLEVSTRGEAAARARDAGWISAERPHSRQAE